MTAGPFKPEDFEAALGICSEDLDNYVEHSDLRWREICERAAESANAALVKMAEKGGHRIYKSEDDVVGILSVKNEALQWCKEFFLERDRMNAKVHCAPLRLSPITERVIRALGEDLPKE